MSLVLEKTYPYLAAVIAALAWIICGKDFPHGDALLSSTLTASGIFVGFLSTSKAILLSMNSGIIGDLRKSGYRAVLVSYIGQAIWTNLIFCTVCVVGYFANQQSMLYALSWVATSVCALACFVRVTNIMLKIFRYS